MTFQSQSDNKVVLVGPCHDSYRAINPTLRSVGLSVTWVQDVEAARFLLGSSRVWLVLCDARGISDELKAFMAEVDDISAGTHSLTLTLPKRSSDPEDLENNMYACKRLLRGVSHLMSAESDQTRQPMMTAA